MKQNNSSPLRASMRRLAPLALILAGAVAAVAAYLRALDYPFISDDAIYLTENTKLAGLHLTELWRLFNEPYNSVFEFLPLRDLSYWLDMKLFGLNPAAFRLHNIILYLLCLPLVYATTSGLWRYFRPADAASAPWAAAAVAALFALHPSHAEAVVWVAGRKDVLSALFSLLALWLAVRAIREGGISIAYSAAALVALLAAMLSKATAVAVAPVIAMLWLAFWYGIPAPRRRRSLLLLPLSSLLLAACIALVFATINTQKVPIYFGVETVTRTLAILGWLARLAVSPESRHFFYPVFEDPYFYVMVALGAAVLAAVTAGAIMFLRKRSLEGFAGIAFLLLCAPSLQLVPYMPPSLVSDRFVFLAVWPAALLLVALSWRLKPAPRIAVLLVIALSWCFQNAERPRDWRSFDALADADLRAYPGYYMPALYKIITVQLPQGLYREANETASSVTIPEFRNILIELIETEHAVHVDAATSGDPREAMALLRKLGFSLRQWPAQSKWNLPVENFWGHCRDVFAAQWDDLSRQFPDNAPVRYNAGLWLLDLYNYKDAVAHLRVAAESQRLPESMRGAAFKNLGFALLRNGNVAEAEAPLRAALEQRIPDLRAHCLLAEVYKQTKRPEEAARAQASCPGRVTNDEISR